MDAFYASVEILDNPSLRGKPVLVGGSSRRGVVAAASYEARVFGVHSAMPMAVALRKCPHAIVVAGRHGRYGEVSAHVFEIFGRYTPSIEGLSLDEAFLDVTASRALFGEGEAIAERIRADIFREIGITASAGVARSKFVAKIASDMNKPNGITVVPEDVAPFLAQLPVERMWGVGAKTAPKMRALGFHTFADLANATDARLEAALGTWGAVAGRLARGVDERGVESERQAKSIGHESTYEHDLRTLAEVDRAILSHAERVAERLIAEGLWATGLTVKIKYADFTLRTASARLDEPSTHTQALYDAAREARARILPKEPFSQGVRLVGVSSHGLLAANARPMTLFRNDAHDKKEALEEVLNKVRAKFGDRVTRAELLETPQEVVDEEGRVP